MSAGAIRRGHTSAKSIHTKKLKPWNLMANIALSEKHLAEELERYESADQGARLRSGTSGHKMDGNLGARSRPTLVSQ